MWTNELKVYKIWCKHHRSHDPDNKNQKDEWPIENVPNMPMTRQHY